MLWRDDLQCQATKFDRIIGRPRATAVRQAHSIQASKDQSAELPKPMVLSPPGSPAYASQYRKGCHATIVGALVVSTVCTHSPVSTCAISMPGWPSFSGPHPLAM